MAACQGSSREPLPATPTRDTQSHLSGVDHARRELADAYSRNASRMLGRRTHARHSVLSAECDLRRNVTDSSRHRRNDDRRQDRDRFVSSDDKNRTTLILGFGPPNLTLLRHVHHGSSAIIRADAASVHPISSSVCGISKYLRTASQLILTSH